MANLQKEDVAAMLHEITPERMAFLAEKYGVSKATILEIISLNGPDEKMIEQILSKNRFIR